jgi:hypothetical protein
MKVLVAIASYGPFRRGCLDVVAEAYLALDCEKAIFVNSDIDKEVPLGTELVVGLPTEDPFSLTFAHKQMFANNIENFDVFIYTEDDILVTRSNIEAFLDVAGVLAGDEVAGFFRYEVDGAGKLNYPDAHPPHAWLTDSARAVGGHVFATFSNVHSGCYILTRAQMGRAVTSGGYLIPPHSSWFGMRESAATDPYIRCGLTKRICISAFDRFLVHHIPNNYVGVLGTDQDEMKRQIDDLLKRAT